MISKDFVCYKVSELLPIDSNLYAERLDILVGSAMSKLKSEGIDESIIDEGSDMSLEYCVCVSYQVALDMDMDADVNRTMSQYITRVNTLRTSLLNV